MKLKKGLLILVLGALAHLSSSQGITITSAPTFTQAANAPLAGLLTVQTDVPSRVRISISDGSSTWKRNIFSYSTYHSIPLYGFKFSQINQITVTALDQSRNEFTY